MAKKALAIPRNGLRYWTAGMLAATILGGLGALNVPPRGHDGYPDVAREAMACNSFATVDHIVASQTSGIPDPAGWTSTRPDPDLIGLADALSNTTGSAEAGSPLTAAMTSYIYSLATLGAAINHQESSDSIEDLHQLTGIVANSVFQLCEDALDVTAHTPDPEDLGGTPDPELSDAAPAYEDLTTGGEGR